MLASMPTPRAYSLKQAEIITTFTRATWYRWEKLGYVRLLRVANKTLVPAEEIDRVMAGEAVPHAYAGWRRGQPLRPHRPGRPRTVQVPTSRAKDACRRKLSTDAQLELSRQPRRQQAILRRPADPRSIRALLRLRLSHDVQRLKKLRPR
jgi:hypothetical protein